MLEGTQNRDEAVAKLQQGATITQTEALLRLPDNSRKFVVVAGQPLEVGEEACMLFTFIDLEARKRAEDSLRQSEERFSKAFRLAPVPMVVCRLPDFEAVEANEAFAASFGQGAATASEEDNDSAIGAELREILRAELAAGESVRNREVVLRGAGDADPARDRSTRPDLRRAQRCGDRDRARSLAQYRAQPCRHAVRQDRRQSSQCCGRLGPRARSDRDHGRHARRYALGGFAREAQSAALKDLIFRCRIAMSEQARSYCVAYAISSLRGRMKKLARHDR